MSAANEHAGETLVGAVVLAVAIGFLGFALSRAGTPAGGSGYPLVAEFDRVDGITAGSDVRLSGVKVGAVSTVAIDPATYRARVELVVNRGIEVPIDSAARVASDGLLGGAHVAIEPGGAEDMLPQGGQFEFTQPSVDLLTLFSSVASGAMSGGGGEGGSDGGGDPYAGSTP